MVCTTTLLLFLSVNVYAKLNVVSSTPDFAAIAREIGADKIKVTSLAVGTEDPHFVDAKPSFIRILNQADVLIEGGAELESSWLSVLVNSARNPKIIGSAPGHIVAAKVVQLLEVPQGSTDRSEGDVHPLGNPHFLLNPDNCQAVAALLARSFSQLDSVNATIYQANLKQFEDKLALKQAEWKRLLSPNRGAKIITYHKSFHYLAAFYGLEEFGHIEPKPGVDPSPSHINSLITKARTAGVKLVIIDPFRPRKTAQQVSQSIGAKLLVLSVMPGGIEKTENFWDWFDVLVKQTAEALKP